MKKITSLAISSIALATLSHAEVNGTFSTGYHSDYVYRGVDNGANLEMFDFGLDFTGDCGCGLTWNSGIWYGATDSTSTVDELDFYGSLSKSMELGPITGDVSIGYIRYTYLNDGSARSRGDDGEVFLGLNTEAYGLSLGATAYFGEEGVLDNGTWVDLSAGYGFDITDALSAGIDLGLGFAFGNYNTNGNASRSFGEIDSLALMSAKAGLDYALTEDMTLSAYVTNFQSMEAHKNGVDRTVWGLSAAYSF